MTFLALNINATYLISQKSDLELQEMKFGNKYNELVQEMSQYEASKSGSTNTTYSTSSSYSSNSGSSCGYNDFTDYSSDDSDSSDSTSSSSSDDPYLEYLSQQEKYYEAKKAEIESQLKVINNELESYQKAIENNIKSECAFKISV